MRRAPQAQGNLAMAVEGSMPVAPGRAAMLTGAIRDAAQATGTSFNYLLATAKIESNLDPAMTMQSSSATGLFQFIDQTWLGTLKQAGAAFGYGNYADAIGRDASGRWVVADPKIRKEIMKLRTDPAANAVMAGVFTQQNAAILSKRIGRTPSEGELYIAHFFGPGGAGKLIGLVESNPQASAADVFPLAARANRPIFYDRQGNARSVAGVYAELVRRYQVASEGLGAPATGPVARAGAPAVPPKPPATGTLAVADAVAASAVPPRAGAPPSPVSPPAARFDSLFRDSVRRTAVAPVVAALWSDPSTDAPGKGSPVAFQPVGKPEAQGPEPQNGSLSPLDLFQDMRPNARALFGGST
jgi:hypothetical protein